MSATLVTVLTTVGVSVISLYAGLAAANAQQDRDTMRRQKGMARALLADLQRIDEDLVSGARTQDADHRTPPVEASIHPWVQGTVTQIAEGVPAIVEGYMRLERLLSRLNASRSRTAMSRDALWGTQIEANDSMARARLQFTQGDFDPVTERYGGRDEPPPRVEDWSDSDVPAGVSTPVAGLYQAWVGHRRQLEQWKNDLEGRVSETAKLECSLGDHLMLLRSQLMPIATQAIPTIGFLAWRTAIPMPEDALTAGQTSMRGSEHHER